MNRETVIFIDNFRLILCIIVIISHILDFLDIDVFFNNGLDFLAVGLFFLLSGYLNWYSIVNNKNGFLLRRFKRLLPKYYYSLIICFLISIFFGSTEYNKYLYNLFFLQHLNGIQSIQENIALWSLSYEILLYIILNIFIVNKKYFYIILIFIIFYCMLNVKFFILSIFFIIGILLNKFKVRINFNMKDLKLGKYTYEIYIFHYPVLFILFNIS